MEQPIVLHAKFILSIYRNDASGFTVAKFRMFDGEEKEFIATGVFHDLQFDIIYSLTGYYIEHPKYGMQFKIENYEKMKPNDRESLIRYFSSPLFPGIGKQTAFAIVEALGEQAISIIHEDASVLLTIPKLNEKKRELIYQGVMSENNDEDAMSFFTKLGIGLKTIMKIEAVYGDECVQKVNQNPFLLVEDIDGIGFKTADKIANNLNFEENHPYRLRALILSCVLDYCMSSGDSFITIEKLNKYVIPKLPDSQIVMMDYLDELIQDGLLVAEENRLYHHTQYDSEKAIAQFLSCFPYVTTSKDKIKTLREEIKGMEKDYAITYEDKQIEAIESFFEESFMILTGGPGTGKTTIVKGIINLYKKFYPEEVITCCAPTGRAAKRLSELTGINATTIHSLLHWDLETNTFLVNDKEPIVCDLLIIDEFSMVDAWLFYNLLRASKSITRILIIGDEDQLPSVGAGAVLRDLIEANCFPLVRLHKIFRQSEGSGVISLAHDIREETYEKVENNGDVAFFSCRNSEVKDHIMSIILTAFEKGYNDCDIQILSPMYNGIAGIDTLNSVLQKMINPSDAHRRELKIGYRIFRENDKVLQLKNQPDDNVFNGDIGKIVEIVYASEELSKQHKIVIDFDGTIVEYSGEQIGNITHAYCISIHKSQGSEYPIVIMPIVKEHSYMLQKRLLYTGITRAKSSLILLGDKEVFLKSIHAKERTIRNTTLTKRILEYYE